MAKAKIQNFVFLEVTDPEIDSVLRIVREEVGSGTDQSIHITIGGPYQKPVSSKKLDKIEKKLEGDQLLIANSGVFHNKNEAVVYYQVGSQNLRKVWHKPDYPGFNPHISIYRGTDVKFANLLKKFLDKNRVELLCSQFEVTNYVSKQKDLFPERQNRKKQFVGLLKSGKLDPMFLDRLARFVAAYKSGFFDTPSSPSKDLSVNCDDHVATTQ